MTTDTNTNDTDTDSSMNRRVEVAFYTDDGKTQSRKFYEGKIIDVETNGGLVRYHVEFDDGDKFWINIKEQISFDAFKWLPVNETGVPATAPVPDVSASDVLGGPVPDVLSSRSTQAQAISAVLNDMQEDAKIKDEGCATSLSQDDGRNARPASING